LAVQLAGSIPKPASCELSENLAAKDPIVNAMQSLGRPATEQFVVMDIAQVDGNKPDGFIDSTSPQEMKKFDALSGLFKKYAGQYDFDYLMMMAQGYQESMLEQSVRSPGGAVGIMQVMPRDAAAAPINVPDVWTTEGS
jgi:hypothetical protein